MNHSKLRVILLPLLGLMLAACTTTPYTRHMTPGVQGKIFIDGKPASGIPIFLSSGGDDEHCLKYSSKTTTDLQGEFNLPSLKESLPYTPLMTHYLDEWVVCAEIDGQRVKLYADNRYGMGSVIGSVTVRCRFEPGRYFIGSCEHRRSARFE